MRGIFEIINDFLDRHNPKCKVCGNVLSKFYFENSWLSASYYDCSFCDNTEVKR
jgi:hypothetical protein